MRKCFAIISLFVFCACSNRMVLPSRQPNCPFIENPQKVNLPNGMKLFVSDKKSLPFDKEISMYEDCVMLEKADGENQIIAVGGWFDDPQRFLLITDDANLVRIKETLWPDPHLMREYQLKCSGSECYFVVTGDCLLDLPRPEWTVDDMRARLAEIAAKPAPVKSRDELDEHEKLESMLNEIFVAALSGSDQHYKFFMNLDKEPNAPMSMRGTDMVYINETYNVVMRPMAKNYARKCF